MYQANLLDIATNSGYMLIVFLGALSSDHAHKNTIADMLLVICCVVVFLFLLTGAYCVSTASSLRGKTFQFFLCHHKVGAGGFARLLKMRLKAHPRVPRQVFLDSDNLRDLNHLFNVVSNETETLVVLCTTEILSRPWCVGEMTTARLHHVDTILVFFPDFRWPSREFVGDYSQHVSGILSLAAYGISEEMARATLLWLASRPVILLPSTMSVACADAVAGKLVGRRQGKCETAGVPGMMSAASREEKLREVFRAEASGQADDAGLERQSLGIRHQVFDGLTDGAIPLSCEVVSVADLSNWQAVCTALVVKELLKGHFPLLSRVSYLLGPEEHLPENTATVLVVCSNGCFHCPRFVGQLMQAQALSVNLLPIIAEESFRFPSEQWYQELSRLSPHLLSSSRYAPRLLVPFVRRLFQQIATHVSAQDSESALQVRVAAIAQRLSGRSFPAAVDTSSEGLIADYERDAVGGGVGVSNEEHITREDGSDEEHLEDCGEGIGMQPPEIDDTVTFESVHLQTEYDVVVLPHRRWYHPETLCGIP